MFKWLKRERPAPEPPNYTAIARTPQRGVPQALADAEASAAFAERCEQLQAQLLESGATPDDVLFTQLGTPEGLLTIPLPDGSGQCVPLFTSPLRAADYARVHFSSANAVVYRRASASELVDMLPALHAANIRSAAIDRCPRCAVFMTVSLKAGSSARDVITLWAITRSSSEARGELWLAYAEEALRAGDAAVARDIALESVAHIAPDLVRAHVLLRDVAVAAGDLTLLGEARAYLRFLREAGA